MNGPEDTPTVAYGGVPNFRLTPPQAIAPVSAEAARTAVPLPPDLARAVDEQVARLAEVLAREDSESDSFKAALASVGALGHDAIETAQGLVQGRFLERNFIGSDETAGDRTIAEIRRLLAPLDPRGEGDLGAPQKLFGVIPLGNKLKAYARKVEVAGPPLQRAIAQLHDARDGVQKDVVDIESARGTLWSAMQQLAAATRFAAAVEGELAERGSAVQAAARQALDGILGFQAQCVAGYLALDVLKKAGREMMNGYNRVDSTLGRLIIEAARHPLPAADLLRDLFDQAGKALEAMESFRATAAPVLLRNRVLVEAQLLR